MCVCLGSGRERTHTRARSHGGSYTPSSMKAARAHFQRLLMVPSLEILVLPGEESNRLWADVV